MRGFSIPNFPTCLYQKRSIIAPMMERITFNTSGWHEHERSKQWVAWGNGGDVLSLTAYPPPGLVLEAMQREYWLD